MNNVFIYLYQNYPNPFNHTTKINFGLPEAGNVELKIYNITGQLVEILVHDFRSAGTYFVFWDATGFGSGIYFYTMIVDGKLLSVKKAVFLR